MFLIPMVYCTAFGPQFNGIAVANGGVFMTFSLWFGVNQNVVFSGVFTAQLRVYNELSCKQPRTLIGVCCYWIGGSISISEVPAQLTRSRRKCSKCRPMRLTSGVLINGKFC